MVDAASGVVDDVADAERYVCSGPEVLNSRNAVTNLLYWYQGRRHNPRGTWWPFWSLGPPRAGPFFLSLLVVLMMVTAAVVIDVDGMGATSCSC